MSGEKKDEPLADSLSCCIGGLQQEYHRMGSPGWVMVCIVEGVPLNVITNSFEYTVLET